MGQVNHFVHYKLIQFAEHTQFQLKCITVELFSVYNGFLGTLGRINCILHRCTVEWWTHWDLVIVRELSM